MITRHSLPRRSFAAIAASLALVALLFLQPIRADQTADAKAAAAIATNSWLTGIDAGGYETSWTTASAFFKKELTSAQWQAALKKTRTPLGKCLKREVVSSLLQTDPSVTVKGEFVISQYKSSFENLSSALETVTFMKESDGTWKAAGYFIKPN